MARLDLDSVWGWASKSAYQSLFLLGIIVFITYLLTVVIYRIYFHPLAKYPGPLLGKITEWNTIWASLKGESTRTRHAWALKYGPVVRIGPNELLFADIQSVKDIYGQTSSICLKDPDFYGPFTVTGARNVFNALDRAEHARIRRLLSHAFAMSEIKKTQTRIIPIMERALGQIESSPRPVNVFEPFSLLFLDIISELSFDQSFNCLEGEYTREAKDADAVQNISALRGMFPLIEWVPTSFVQEAVKARPRLIKFARERIEGFRAKMKTGAVKEGSFLKRVVDYKDDSSEQPLTDEELMENAIVFIQAGSETSLSTLLYLLYEVDRKPAVKARLVKEIREAFPDRHSFPSFDTAEKLHYLNQVLDETLRLRGPIPVNLPRISPGKEIAGRFVPAGTRVCNLAYTTHRDPTIFAEPESFIPERWEEATTEMKLAFRPFSTGPRNCIGLHLARVQILLIVCALYARYDIQVDESITEDMMVARDRGVMTPHAQTLLLRIKPRIDQW